jgi:hypothetical protein
MPMPIHSQKPSFLQTIKEGLGFGVGSSIGHRIVGMMFSQVETPVKNKEIKLKYEQCMKKYDDIAVCKEFLK